MKNGGYAIISHDDINIFNKIDSAYKAQKPILFYDDDKTCFYVDSVKVNGDGDYEFTKGGKTWTVTDNNTLSSEGKVKPQTLYTYYFNANDNDSIDGDGFIENHKRYMSFISDNPNLASMDIKDFKSDNDMQVQALNASYFVEVSGTNNEIFILQFAINYDSDNNKLLIVMYDLWLVHFLKL